jgi:hypothetical protein
MRKSKFSSCGMRPWLVVLTSVFFAGYAPADVTGTIRRTVTDLSGSAVAGAKTTLTNGGTGLNRELTTDGNGTFEFLAAPVGAPFGKRLPLNFGRSSSISSIMRSFSRPLGVSQRYVGFSR